MFFFLWWNAAATIKQKQELLPLLSQQSFNFFHQNPLLHHSIKKPFVKSRIASSKPITFKSQSIVRNPQISIFGSDLVHKFQSFETHRYATESLLLWCSAHWMELGFRVISNWRWKWKSMMVKNQVLSGFENNVGLRILDLGSVWEIEEEERVFSPFTSFISFPLHRFSSSPSPSSLFPKNIRLISGTGKKRKESSNSSCYSSCYWTLLNDFNGFAKMVYCWMILMGFAKKKLCLCFEEEEH